jgi:glycerate 2-kinase
MHYRTVARKIFIESLNLIRLDTVVHRHVQCVGGVLHVDDMQYSLADFREISIVSLWKAAVPFAEALSVLEPEMMPGQHLEGLVVGSKTPENLGMKFFLGGHPTPNDQSRAAAEAVLAFLSDCGSDCLLFFLINGGASAMIEKPLDPTITGADTAVFHQVLVQSGLRIEEMNTLRKHFSAVRWSARYGRSGGNAVHAAHIRCSDGSLTCHWFGIIDA